MSADIDAADIVKHLPTGEEWLVAFVRDDRLWWVGWPQGFASVHDCVLVEKATPEARQQLLRAMASMSEQDDPRARYAVQRLQDEVEKNG